MLRPRLDDHRAAEFRPSLESRSGVRDWLDSPGKSVRQSFAAAECIFAGRCPETIRRPAAIARRG